MELASRLDEAPAPERITLHRIDAGPELLAPRPLCGLLLQRLQLLGRLPLPGARPRTASASPRPIRGGLLDRVRPRQLLSADGFNLHRPGCLEADA
jgi:hypothetical protein